MTVTTLTGGVGADVLVGTPTSGGRTATDPPSSRVLAATITCLGRWGVTKTTLDDIAREAGCSRATVYRLFPGGKDTVLVAAATAEADRLFEHVREAIGAQTSLEDAVVAGLTTASAAARDHAALQYLLQHEPDQVLPHLAFARLEALLGATAGRVGPWLAPWLGDEPALRAAEWLIRLVISYALAPSDAFDLAVEGDARRFARTFILPGLVEVARLDDPERHPAHG